MGTWRRTEWRNCRPAATANHRNSFTHKHLRPASGGTPTPLGGKGGARFATSDSSWRSAGRACGRGKTRCTMRRRASRHERPETARVPLSLGSVRRYHAHQPPTDEARKSCSSNEDGVFGRQSGRSADRRRAPSCWRRARSSAAITARGRRTARRNNQILLTRLIRSSQFGFCAATWQAIRPGRAKRVSRCGTTSTDFLGGAAGGAVIRSCT